MSEVEVEHVNPARWLFELRKAAEEVAEKDLSVSSELMRIVLEAHATCKNCPLGGGEPCSMGCFLPDFSEPFKNFFSRGESRGEVYRY